MHRWPRLACALDQLPAVHARPHPHVRDHDVEWLAGQALQRFFARRSGDHGVTLRTQNAPHHAAHTGLVIHGQDAQSPRRGRGRVYRALRNLRRQRCRQRQPECRPQAQGGLHHHVPVVLLHDTKNLRQSEAGAALALGGEERLEHALLHLRTHAQARFGHLDHHILAYPAGGQANGAPAWKRVDRVEDQVGQRLAQADGPSLNHGVAVCFHLQRDVPPSCLWRVSPARRRELSYLAHQGCQINPLGRVVRLGSSERQ